MNVTSDELLVTWPFLLGQPNWTKFVEHFDSPPCIKARADAVIARMGPPMSPEVQVMLDLVQRIEKTANVLSSQQDPKSGEYQERLFRQASELVENSLALASKARLLLTDNSEGDLLRAEVNSEIKRQRFESCDDSERPVRMGYEALTALFTFIDRERRLPSKRELNIEAGRNHKVTVWTEANSPFEHGQGYPNHKWWMIQHCHAQRSSTDPRGVWRVNIATGEILNATTTYEVGLVDTRPLGAKWNETRWEASTFSTDVIEPYGLKGLLRHKTRG